MNIGTKLIRRGPSLNKERYWHGCSRIRDESILVAGGPNNGRFLSTEILKIGNLKWTIGPDLKEETHFNEVVRSNAMAYIAYSIGGITDHEISSKIYGLNINKNEWQLLDNMKEPRWYGSALNVPSNLIPWCKI